MISVLILAKNESEMIVDCLKSLTGLHDYEVILIDDGSTDETCELATRYGAKIIRNQKINFSQARQLAASRAGGEWLLYLDADERLSAELVNDINQAVRNNKQSAYYLQRVNFYLGRKWPVTEYIIRLMHKTALVKWQGDIHETAIINGNTGRLNAPLYHYTHRQIKEMVENTLVWSEIEASLRLSAGHPPVVWWRLIRVMLTQFHNYYFRQSGWRVGTVGLIESIYQSFSIFITYARLWEMQNKRRHL